MAYTPTNWVNDSAPAINATNLNKIETGIDDAHDDLDAATDAATAGELIRRDGSGRAKVATPSASGDIANKGYVDGLASDYATAAQGATADTAVQPGDLATVATTGAYSDLTGKPTLGALASQDDVSVSDIDATGTADGTTYLRGDGTWATPSGGGGSVALFTVPTPVYAAIGAYQPSIPVRGTNTYGTGGSDTSRRLAYPFIPSSDFTADQIGIEVTTAGSAGSVERLAIYGSNAAENYPDTLIAEAASTADCTSTGYKMLTLTGGVAFTKGVLYWIAWGGEVATCTLRVYGTMELPKYPDTQARVFSATFNTAALLSGTGAFPGSWGTGGWANAQIPSIAFRRSA